MNEITNGLNQPNLFRERGHSHATNVQKNSPVNIIWRHTTLIAMRFVSFSHTKAILPFSVRLDWKAFGCSFTNRLSPYPLTLQEKKFTCPTCGKGFGRNWLLQQHLPAHSVTLFSIQNCRAIQAF